MTGSSDPYSYSDKKNYKNKKEKQYLPEINNFLCFL